MHWLCTVPSFWRPFSPGGFHTTITLESLYSNKHAARCAVTENLVRGLRKGTASRQRRALTATVHSGGSRYVRPLVIVGVLAAREIACLSPAMPLA